MRYLAAPLVPLAFCAAAAQAQTPPYVQPLPPTGKEVILEIRLKGAPTATNPLPTVRLIMWETTGALRYTYTVSCWNTASPCPAVHAVTVRVLRPVWGMKLNITRVSGLCNSSECLLPGFTPLQAKPGEGYWFSYDRTTAHWTEQPKIVAVSTN